ncbi:MvaI/BcnI family restriction endonuclease [Aurantiacibacter sp. MUD61]|uniref:MvaI/BcnI family restriction endonuclease n=1 Tax=Aurantiacibacter sp. MUD61 TaxID=3009083 RepID=UPI0022F111BC|nr:MvaI/BcnI family restriction endonuclease [Aurantiacibacter sp. MUD61]
MIECLKQLIDLMQTHGATRFYAKRLAPNDNSKNQIYLGGDFSALNVLPHGEIYTDDGSQGGGRRDRAKASLDFWWLSAAGLDRAPHANLILYPKYPEVRFSGFLKGCKNSPSKILTVRDEGRVLVLGVAPEGRVLGFAVEADHPIAREVRLSQWQMIGVFDLLPAGKEKRTSRSILLSELRRIYELNWILSQKLAPDGTKHPYAARNGGGYTLEAELGVSPNGYAEPDFLGWEIKQYGVADFKSFRPKSPVTLMTPEPTGGLYREKGPDTFVMSYGYPDKSGKPDRMNFGGVYACGKTFHKETGLQLELVGYDSENDKITDMDGAIALVSNEGKLAASWAFKSLMKHWNRKHAQAAYVPSLYKHPPPQYSYGPKALLCERTDFLMYLKAVSAGLVYYDPGIKLEKVSTRAPKLKRRSQFRVKHSELHGLYEETVTENLL